MNGLNRTFSKQHHCGFAATKMAAILIAAMVGLSMGMMTGCDQKDGHAGHDHHDHKEGDHKDHGDHKDDHSDQSDDHKHVHTAPHGGQLMEVGEHQANVEWVFDAKTGTLTAYMLGAHAQAPVMLKDPAVEVTIKPNGPTGTDGFTVALKAVGDEIAGTSVGNTAMFEGADDRLKGLASFDIAIESLTLKGTTFDKLKHTFRVGDGEKHDH